MKFQKAVLEYRLQKGKEHYVPIYHYPEIELEQILARRECEFFVKDGVTYKQLSSAIEDDLFIIYLEIHEENPIEKERPSQEGIALEIRELNSIRDHPLITSEHFTNHIDVLSIIGSVYTYYNGMEWERDSAEIDEDRQVYILYMTSTGYQLSAQGDET
ncbi:hypothetical protein JMM81_11920 [Bacillus sp. V3B]|uniref:hypothetical protein n=1 Tax=Bacillus sp. V3B TaxID=2804915 RepID=UPI00210D741B|nr:hypothetical protein [Bacillus sp. V3B]MCQ6275666.1 hypothetical protein [Bacillus sp. V3B]